MRLLRFEAKIVLALLLVALAPLVASLVLGRSALQDTYRVGVNQRIRGQLEESLDVYRSYFLTSRREADAIADVVAARVSFEGLCREAAPSGEALRAILEPYPAVRGAQLMRSDTEEPCASVQSKAPEGAAAERTLELERRVHLQPNALSAQPDAPELTLRVVVATDARPFDAYQEAGEVVEVYRRLQDQDDVLSRTYWGIYIVCLLLVIAVAGTVAIYTSRRVTRRIAVLIDATKQVGTGDLSVAVTSKTRDEIAELTDSFNKMVNDLRASRARVDYLNRVSGWQEFAKRLAHEIKNPLTPIQLAAQEIERSFVGEDPRHRRALGEARVIIEEEVATLRRMVGAFSSFAKLPDVQLAPANLREFVEELRSLLPAIEADLESAVAIELDLPEGQSPVQVAFDGMLLRRCFDNLFRNAAQAALEARNDSVRLSVALDVRDEQAILMVSDTGPGMDEDTQLKMFQPHFTTKREGSGLGLAIVKKIILEHGGDITCDSVTDTGTRFKIQLPLLSAPA